VVERVTVQRNTYTEARDQSIGRKYQSIRRIPQVLINAVTGEVKFLVSGNATYQEASVAYSLTIRHQKYRHRSLDAVIGRAMEMLWLVEVSLTSHPLHEAGESCRVSSSIADESGIGVY
jgi:hypothetical protein